MNTQYGLSVGILRLSLCFAVGNLSFNEIVRNTHDEIQKQVLDEIFSLQKI